MNKQAALERSQRSPIKALIGSLIGIGIFFVPFPSPSGETRIPLVIFIDYVKSLMGGYLEYVTLGIILLLCVTWVISKFTANSRLERYHKKDNNIIGCLFFLAAFFALLVVFQIGPGWLLKDDIGGLALRLGGSVLLTVTIAGFFVFFLTEFGFPEFIGTLMEPLMRPIYRVPGRAAVDAVASFVASPAVGVYITNQIYKEGNYTQREAASIATNFSVVSIGFFALLASIGDILPYLPHMLVTSFIVTFIVAAIATRIPPLSRKQDRYFNGELQTDRKADSSDGRHILARAISAASERAASTGPEAMPQALWSAITFAQKIVAYVLAIATVALLLAAYTPIFEYLGIVFEPVLSALQLPDAEKIAPAILISIAEIALPAIVVSGMEVAPMSVFFVLTLSTVQIIFFTESANAMLESDIPLTFWDLIVIFLIRTVVAIPLIAIATHIIF